MDEAAWHLDKKVPIAIIVTLVMQSLIFIWVGATWKAGLDYRIEALERSEALRKPQDERLIRLEERVIGIATLLEKLDKRLQDDQQESTP